MSQPSLSNLSPSAYSKLGSKDSMKYGDMMQHDHHTSVGTTVLQEQKYHGLGFGWVGILFLWLIIFLMLFWIILYSLNPAFVQNLDTGNVDTAKVLLWAFIMAIVLVIILWVIWMVMHRKRC